MKKSTPSASSVTTRSWREIWLSGLSIEWTWKSLPTKPGESMTLESCAFTVVVAPAVTTAVCSDAEYSVPCDTATW